MVLSKYHVQRSKNGSGQIGSVVNFDRLGWSVVMASVCFCSAVVGIEDVDLFVVEDVVVVVVVVFVVVVFVVDVVVYVVFLLW